MEFWIGMGLLVLVGLTQVKYAHPILENDSLLLIAVHVT